MIAVYASRAASFLQTPDKRIFGFLLYGTDDGQISERAGALAHALQASHAGAELISLSEQDLSHEPGRLAVEARTVSLFGAHKIIRVRGSGSSAITAAIEALTEDMPEAAHLICEAGNLKKSARLRQIFERGKALAAIPCYGDEAQDLSALIHGEFERAGLTIGGAAERHLRGLLGADHLVSVMEIRKLALYAAGAGEVTLEDVDAVVGDSSSLAVDAAIDTMLAGDAEGALMMLDRLAMSGSSAAAFLALLETHLLRLHALSLQVAAGEALDAALRRLRPPVHFKREAAFRAQVRAFPPHRIAMMIAKVREAVRTGRLNPAMENAVAAQIVLGLGSAQTTQRRSK